MSASEAEDVQVEPSGPSPKAPASSIVPAWEFPRIRSPGIEPKMDLLGAYS